MLFISPQKLFLFSRYLNFCLDFLVMQKNDLIRKMRLISKFTPQPGNKQFHTHIAQYLEKQRRLENEIWSVNRHGKYFF